MIHRPLLRVMPFAVLVTAITCGLLPGTSAALGQPERMVWADPGAGRIDRAELDGSNPETILSGGSPVGVAVDAADGSVYFTERASPRIAKCDLDGSNIVTLVSAGLTDPTDIELDLVNGKMYWTEPIGGRVSRADLDGTNVETLYVFNAIAPKGLALDVANLNLYWTNINGGSIYRAPMSLGGQEERLLEFPDVFEPYDIEFDAEAQAIFWSEPGPSLIKRAEPDGANVEVVFVADAIAPAGLALDTSREYIYFTDNRTLRVWRIDYDLTIMEPLYGGDLVDPAFIDLQLNDSAEDCLSLEVADLVAGETATWTVSRGAPGAGGVIVWGIGGPPTAFDDVLGFCATFDFRVRGERQVVRYVRFRADGTARIARRIPQSLSGFDIQFQAAEQGTCPEACMSNVIRTVIE